MPNDCCLYEGHAPAIDKTARGSMYRGTAGGNYHPCCDQYISGGDLRTEQQEDYFYQIKASIDADMDEGRTPLSEAHVLLRDTLLMYDARPTPSDAKY